MPKNVTGVSFLGGNLQAIRRNALHLTVASGIMPLPLHILWVVSVGGTLVNQYVFGMGKQEAVAPSKAAKVVKVPSLLKMIQEDPELKDFFKFLHESGYRDQAAVLLGERLEKKRESIKN